MAQQPRYPGLDAQATAVMLLDCELAVTFVNPAAENLLALSRRQMLGQALPQIFDAPDALVAMARAALAERSSFTEHDLSLTVRGQPSLQLSCTVTPAELGDACLIAEFRGIDQDLRIAREERMALQQQANRELIRNLAHEIKNPLGGIRGAAQLLEHELPRPSLREYTQVIIKEADRLQSLMDRLLTPNRPPKFAPVNIHEVLERVRSLLLAEAHRPGSPPALWGLDLMRAMMKIEEPKGLTVRRDYDTSLPEVVADQESLIQALLNIARNAMQAMNGKGEIVLRTRVARQVTLARRRHRLAVRIDIVDNGPGIPPEIRDTLFYPLVSGRDGGTGLGLTLAQTFVAQHHGVIECESRPGRTCFSVLLPLQGPARESEKGSQ